MKKRKTSAPSRTRSIALGRCARKTLMMAALSEQILNLITQHDLTRDEIHGVFNTRELEYIEKVHDRVQAAQDAKMRKSVREPRIRAPVAPSDKSCSLYCATNPGGTGKCIYCGQPKAKHTKRAQDPDRMGHSK